MPPILSGTLFFFSMALVGAAAGRRLLRILKIQVDGPAEHAVLALGLGLGAFQAIPFTLFALGAGTPAGFKLAAVILSIALLPDLVSILRGAVRFTRGLRAPRLTWWEWAIAGITGSVFASIYPRALCPVTDGDSLAYHLTCAVRLLDLGRFAYLPTLIYTNWPSSTEMLYAFALGVTRDAPVQLVPYTFGLVSVAGATLLARRHFGRAAAAAVPVLLMVYPRFWWEMASGMVDLTSAAFGTLTVYSFARWVTLDPERNGEPRRAWLLLSAFFAGLAATTKLNGVWVIPSMSLVVYMSGRGEEWNGRLWSAVRYTLTGIAVVLPWFVRTWIVTGNPLYPAFYRFLGGVEWTPDGWERFHNYHLQFNTFPGMEPTPAVLFWSHWAHAGVALAIALAVVYATRRSAPAVAGAARFAAFFSFALCAFSFYALRYLFAAYPAAIAAAAALIRPRAGRAAITGAVTVACGALLAFPLIRSRVEPDLGLAVAFAAGQVSRDEYLARRLPEYPLVAWANSSLPAGSRVVVGCLDVHTALYRFPAFWSDYWRQDSIHYDSLARLEGDLRRLGATHLVLQDQTPPGVESHLADRVRAKLELPLLNQLAARRGQKLYGENGFSIYRLDLSGAEPLLPARK